MKWTLLLVLHLVNLILCTTMQSYNTSYVQKNAVFKLTSFFTKTKHNIEEQNILSCTNWVQVVNDFPTRKPYSSEQIDAVTFGRFIMKNSYFPQYGYYTLYANYTLCIRKYYKFNQFRPKYAIICEYCRFNKSDYTVLNIINHCVNVNHRLLVLYANFINTYETKQPESNVT